ncbi:hypothetical protein [Sediminicurvatus halobius]|uniref:Uncharacterized protein n=1 Tax=Sediminicurvatus halobius TaxID=2182432 RepID=A0A2U2N8M7_9GAMM|nr:hypothetical protein [Spiribacter halobius]PWG65433.1 hypothetical protein DEM34_01440 [Spiribacter halobius]UEX76453.1 hypothetical protein LMH63_10815 [Spiribacter halobius]
MHHDGITISTGNAKQAGELAARIEAVAGHEGVHVRADGDRLSIGFTNPGLADFIHVVCRGIAAITLGLGRLARRDDDAAPGLPSRS